MSLTTKASGYVFIACSLDGFIADRQGGLSWLDVVQQEGEDYGYHEFMSGMDAILMGRNSFDTVRGFGEWPYQLPVYVLSHRPLPQPLPPQVQQVSGSPEAVMQTLQNDGVVRLYVDGGQTISQFLEAGLISEMILSRIPVLLGEGVPLFGPNSGSHWQHLQTRSFASGLVQSHYRWQC